MKERIKKFNYKRLILPLIVILSEVFLYFQMMDLQPKLTAKYQWMFLAVCICANIACLVILWLLKKFDKMKIQTVFLTIAGIYGGLYMVFVPALLGTDELPHFLRPYQISVGDVIVKHPEKNETMIPKNIGEFVGEDKMADRYTDKYLLHESSYDDTVNLWNGDVTSIDYSPIPYLPQVIGFWIARLFHLSPLFTMYMVRFCNFMTWLGLGYLAFKILPVKKIFALILYTSPAVLSLVSTCSGDAFSLGLFFVFIAYILQFIYNKREVKKKDIVLLTLISLGFSTYKVFYVPYVLFLFLIPKSCFKDSLKRKVGTILPIIFGAFLLDFLWFMASAVSQVSSGLVSEQIEYILMNPLKYVFTFINTYVTALEYFIPNITAGTEMCYGLVRINQILIYGYCAFFFASYFFDNKKSKVTKSGKWLVILVCLAIFGLVSTTLYLGWTSSKLGVGSSSIIGIQSRYFWPLLIPLVCILPNCKKKLKNEKKFVQYAVVLNAVIMINTISSLLIAVFPK